jgi:flagellar motor switch protein FliG
VQTDGVELAPSLAYRLSQENRVGQATGDAVARKRFAALDRADISAVAGALVKERPQAAALVLSHLSPQRAAEVLAHLPEAFQTEVLERVARLADPDPEFVDELERHLEQTVQVAHVASSSQGVPRAAAILQSADPRIRQSLIERLASRDRRLATSLSPSPGANHEHAHRPLDELRDDAGDERVAFGDLAALNNRAWLRILGACDPQLAILALAGADGALVERILKSLPRRDRKRLRQEMNGIGPLQLRDVDRAQRRLADAAANLAAAGAISLPG